MKSQVIIVTVTLFGYVCAANYKRGYGGVDGKAVGNRHRRDASGRYGGSMNYARKPYAFRYSVQDGQGNSHFRYEYTDEFGAVSGSYGYEDASGLYRVVDYVADARGFRANVKTNEPGAANIQTIPEKPASGFGVGSDSPSVKNVTEGVKKGSACKTDNERGNVDCYRIMGAG